jgi:hypothetical protein
MRRQQSGDKDRVVLLVVPSDHELPVAVSSRKCGEQQSEVWLLRFDQRGSVENSAKEPVITHPRTSLALLGGWPRQREP